LNGGNIDNMADILMKFLLIPISDLTYSIVLCNSNYIWKDDE